VPIVKGGVAIFAVSPDSRRQRRWNLRDSLGYKIFIRDNFITLSKSEGDQDEDREQTGQAFHVSSSANIIDFLGALR
jgi:hypothetical protein